MPDAGLAGRREEVGVRGLGVEEEFGGALEHGRVGVEAHDLHPVGQYGPLRVAGEGAYGPACGEEAVDEGTAYVSGGAGY